MNLTEAKKKMPISGRIKKEFKKHKYVYLMMIPVALYYLIFYYGPMAGIVIAFKDYNIGKGIIESSWVGLKHFRAFFDDIYCVRIIKNTFLISFYSLLVGFPAPILFALLLNEIKSMRYKKTIQTITYLPHFISLVVICGMITDFFSAEGIITSFLTKLGMPELNYLGEAKYFRPIYVLTDIWQKIGWDSIIYLAALTGVDESLYEAAAIDGARKFRRIWHITIPSIMPTIIIMLIMRVGSIMSLGYEKIILLYSPATYETADIISSYVYRRGLGGAAPSYSYSSAIGMFQSVVNLTLLLTVNRISAKVSETSLF